jgi:hypothetical protein
MVTGLVKRAGGDSALAAALGVSRDEVVRWMAQGWIPVRHAARIEQLYGVKAVDLIHPEIIRLTGYESL